MTAFRYEIELPPPTRSSLFASACALGATLLLAGLVVGPRSKLHCFCETKNDIAGATVKKYAFEAYPSWAAAHPDEACPERLEQLNEYMNNKDTRDPWGSRYVMFCRFLPPGAKGIAVMSPGEDGRFGTGDDVKSW